MTVPTDHTAPNSRDQRASSFSSSHHPAMEKAKELAKLGFWVFPIKPNEKTPAVSGWQKAATLDPFIIEKYFCPKDNIGISTEKFGNDDGALLVIDVDVKNGKDGKGSLAKLGFLPKTLTALTPSGGFHLIFKTPNAVRQGVNVLGDGLDIRSGGGYIVAPGSSINGKGYEANLAEPLASAPSWLLTKCGEHRRRESAQRAPLGPLDQPLALARVKRYLEEEAPLAIQGGGGDHETFKVACRVKDMGLSERVCLDSMLEYWNERCSPPWSYNGLSDKVRNAYAYGREAPGSSDPANQFDVIEVAEPIPGGPEWLLELNKKYAVTRHLNKMMVHQIVYDHELGFRRHDWVSFEDFKKEHMHERVELDRSAQGDTKMAEKGAAWLKHPQRRQFTSEAFLPGQEAPKGVLNLWNGWEVEPKQGDWSLMRSHIEDVICGGDKESFAYLLKWLARLVQEPSKQGETIIVLQGAEGTGKGFFVNYLKAVFGQHAIQVAQPKHLVGHFNDHLRGTILVFADEALFAGDPSQRGIIYSLATEPTLQIEKKGFDAMTAKNNLHIIMASNENWVVQAGEQARRYVVLRVSDRYQQDTGYFAVLRREQDHGGPAAMLHDLLLMDIAGFDVRKIPHTEALAEQKVRSLRGTAAWLYDCLHGASTGASGEWSEAGIMTVSKRQFYDSYRHWAKNRPRAVTVVNKGIFAKELKAAIPGCVETHRPQVGKSRERCFDLAPLTVARKAFEATLGSKIDWDDEVEEAIVSRDWEDAAIEGGEEAVTEGSKGAATEDETPATLAA